MPTYHLANVVDDYLMGITHVIRGEEWLPSTPYTYYYTSLWAGKTLCQNLHLPLILKPNGNGKLSKRMETVWVFLSFQPIGSIPKREKNILVTVSADTTEAFNNMLAFLGWNPGTTQELFSMKS